jgi:hypothetical protein
MYFELLTHSYAVPKEVGKVGAESPTFIEPVQKRKDGIEAMFMRQSKAQKSEPDPPSLSVGIAPPAKSAKRKRERSPGKSPKPEAVDVDADSDVEILSDPLQSVRHSFPTPHSHTRASNNSICILLLMRLSARALQVHQRRRVRKVTPLCRVPKSRR